MPHPQGPKQTGPERNKQLAQHLLQWNRAQLTHRSALSQAAIAEVFAPHFVVKANGRVYEANHDNYKTFLDGFRQSIESIDYAVHDMVSEAAKLVLTMGATVRRVSGAVDTFEAMLLLQFDEHEKICLWHEVYVQGPSGV